jgi:hypothetical protein
VVSGAREMWLFDTERRFSGVEGEDGVYLSSIVMAIFGVDN